VREPIARLLDVAVLTVIDHPASFRYITVQAAWHEGVFTSNSTVPVDAAQQHHEKIEAEWRVAAIESAVLFPN
jgi:hypothetical protein